MMRLSPNKSGGKSSDLDRVPLNRRQGTAVMRRLEDRVTMRTHWNWCCHCQDGYAQTNFCFHSFYCQLLPNSLLPRQSIMHHCFYDNACLDSLRRAKQSSEHYPDITWSLKLQAICQTYLCLYAADVRRWMIWWCYFAAAVCTRPLCQYSLLLMVVW